MDRSIIFGADRPESSATKRGFEPEKMNKGVRRAAAARTSASAPTVRSEAKDEERSDEPSFPLRQFKHKSLIALA